MPTTTSPAPVKASVQPPPPGAAAARKALFWDRIAPKYAADPIADMAGYEATLQRVQGLLSAGQEVLEIGCGTGSTALRLAPFTRRLLATDVSPGMIAIAQARLAAQPTPQLGFAVADADAPGWGQGTYDVVMAFNMLHLVSDLDHTLQLAVQALRPGGLLISKTPCIAEMNPLIPWLAIPLMRAIGKAPAVLSFEGPGLHAAIARQGMDIVSVERHGTRGKDIRLFIVARKPPEFPHSPSRLLPRPGGRGPDHFINRGNP
ncbi:class I SAM-dependent methyltransferase [Acidovorax sp.]|uniref:class I SAM-dependent methyltransferase n=1 Tax=Acidovorax sp. TaxID=1872122 RepID=UPI00391F92AB